MQGAHVLDSISSAMEVLKDLKSGGKLEYVFVIGGGQVYAEALQSPQCSAVHLTAVRPCLSLTQYVHALRKAPSYGN